MIDGKAVLRANWKLEGKE